MFRPCLIALSLAAVSVVGCRSGAPSAQKTEATEKVASPLVASASPTGSAAAAGDRSVRRFGAALAEASPLPLSRVLNDPDGFADKTVTVEAKVRRNCTRRGCWMEIAEGSDLALPGCRVTFKDYGFFVPLDSAGSSARVQGTVEVRKVPQSEVDHLESEGAKFAKKEPDGSAREVRVVASGVELWREPG